MISCDSALNFSPHGTEVAFFCERKASAVGWQRSILPRTASLPGTAPMPLGRHSKNQRHEELLDVVNNGLERNGLDVELVLPVEGSPLELLRFVLKELGRKRDRRFRREAGLASL